MPLLRRLIPDDTHIGFMALRPYTIGASLLAMALSLLLVWSIGLNFGIDFRGGTLLEVRTSGPADLGRLRQILGGLDLGSVQLQNFGDATEVLIRFEKQAASSEEQQALIESVKSALQQYDPGISVLRVEYVGPKVSRELLRAGILAVLLALGLVLIYIWFRFEWQFGVGAIIALIHDVIITIGALAVTQYEFDLSTVAALLTIVGYSLNDTVVVYDRIRESLRLYKTMPISDVIDKSINSVLPRTVLTSLTTLLAVIPLFVLGGEVLRSFTFAIIFGILIGTYSSIYIAAPCLIWFNLRPVTAQGEEVVAGAGR